jgi:hypothetical protein
MGLITRHVYYIPMIFLLSLSIYIHTVCIYISISQSYFINQQYILYHPINNETQNCYHIYSPINAYPMVIHVCFVLLSMGYPMDNTYDHDCS